MGTSDKGSVAVTPRSSEPWLLTIVGEVTEHSPHNCHHTDYRGVIDYLTGIYFDLANKADRIKHSYPELSKAIDDDAKTYLTLLRMFMRKQSFYVIANCDCGEHITCCPQHST